jgi:hypothetical protein
VIGQVGVGVVEGDHDGPTGQPLPMIERVDDVRHRNHGVPATERAKLRFELLGRGADQAWVEIGVVFRPRDSMVGERAERRHA